jgi:hypothetical protein
MGCQVQLSTEQPYFRTNKVKAVSYLHMLRAVVYIALSFVIDDVFMTLVWIGVAELLVAGWFWSLKMESWGLSMGLCVVQFLFPISLGISLIGGFIILGAAVVQMALLALIRGEGGYNFNQLANLDQAETREADLLQRRMFHLAVLAQIMKSLSVLVSGLATLAFLGWLDPILWLAPLPLFPVTLLLGMVNLIAGYGFFAGKDWGFHLTIIMVPVSFIETLLTLNGLIFLLGIWILTIMIPCLAKDGFYCKLFSRKRGGNFGYTQEVIKTQEHALTSDIE